MKYVIIDNHDIMLYDDHRNLIVFETEKEAQAELAKLDVPHDKFRVVEMK